MPSDRGIGGPTVVYRKETVSINGELHRHKIVNTFARCPTRLVVFKNTINFLSEGFDNEGLTRVLHKIILRVATMTLL